MGVGRMRVGPCSSESERVDWLMPYLIDRGAGWSLIVLKGNKGLWGWWTVL